MVERAGMQRLRQVGIVPAGGRIPVGAAIADPEMPLSHHAGVVSGVAQQRCDGRPFRFDQRIALRTEENPLLQATSPATKRNAS